MSSINSKAMIVTLNVSCWTARKQDKRVSSEVERSHNAHDAGKFNKLLVEKSYLDPLTSYAGAIRQAHYKLTLAWMDNGGRLLPSKLFMQYRNEIDKMKSHYMALVDRFIKVYDPQLIQDARVRLGTMYDPTDYPPGWELRDKFGVEIDIMPVPDGADFRVDIADSEANRIREDIMQRVTSRQRDAAKDAWTRVRNVVSTIETRLSAPKPIIRDSLIENAQELVSLLPSLNINDDPAMTSVAKQITDDLLVDLWTLRNSKATRLATAKRASEILELIPA